MTLSVIGLLIIVAAWGLQFLSVSKKNKSLNPVFLIIYAIGAVLLTIDGFNTGLNQMAVLNLVAVLFAFLTLNKIKG